MDTTSPAPQACINICNRLLRGEISAVQTYDKAIEKFADEPEVTTLIQIREDHQTSVDRLTTDVISMGGEPDLSAGAWGAFANSVQGAANLLGENSAMAALAEGEKHGRREYSDALDNDDVLPGCKAMIQDELLPRINSHLTTLESLSNK